MASLEAVEGSAAAQGNDECDIEDFLTDDDEDDVVTFPTEGILDILFDGAGGGERVHGGSIAGRARNQDRDYDAAVARIKILYFGLNRSPPQVNENTFSKRFGIHREGFDKIYSALATRPEFVQKTDAVGKRGIHPLQRITGALRVLRYGVAYDAVDEIVAVSESVMAQTVKSFCKAIVQEFGAEYLREPNEDDLMRILAVIESRGFPGCESPLRIPYTIHGTARTLPYNLADGIYPPWAIFVKTAKGSNERKAKCFSAHQEAVRKDVERAFGVLLSQYHMLRRPCRMWDKNDAMDVLRACVVLHNMYCEARRDNYNVPLYARATSSEPFISAVQFAPDADVDFRWENSASVSNLAPAGTWAALAAARRAESESEVAHFELRYDLEQHLWRWKDAVRLALGAHERDKTYDGGRNSVAGRRSALCRVLQ
ncbi:unnamed protein product [Chondrus crispus]|uniref:DDE Tnp4 domain-containing protein n=1 Tax=Chondrus crispus TaxID=2769 RepID=R7QQZ9_CHOCR|nr:unnamed protein product [Chondrus crispus]CDF39906.1 unnamed protein product [Chondrus crispus]|eukprot:XP_005710200.1 unnamed protein product [Chondrus crispus]